jgi:hypothetical protein
MPSVTRAQRYLALQSRPLLIVIAGLWLVAAPAALAAPPQPAWTITSVAEPTNFTPGEQAGVDKYVVTATNTGSGPTAVAPTAVKQITVTDTLPPGVTVNATVKASITDDASNTAVSCSGSSTVTCIDQQDVAPLQIGQRIVVTIPVNVPNAPDTVTNSVTVTGGGATSAAASEPTTIGANQAPFAIQSFDGSVANSDGSADTQAGSHPYAATTTFALTTMLDSQNNVIPVGSIKDISVALPPGFVGDPTATPQCTPEQLLSGAFSSCPLAAQIGVVTVDEAQQVLREPVYNMVPPPGMPAQFGFRVFSTAVFIAASVRTGGDYGLTASLQSIPQAFALLGSSLTFWGVPWDPSHDSQRCQDAGLTFTGTCTTPNSVRAQPKPFLTLPTSCAGPQATTFSGDSWQQPGAFRTASFLSHDNQGNPVGASGCNLLDFSPTISAQPTTATADAPTGLNVDLHIPQNTSPTGLAEANLERTVVTLPPGTAVSPSAADGLGACTLDEIGLSNARQPTCPDSSKLGSVEVDTPLLPNPLFGSVFLAQQNNNPFGSLLALYLVAQGDGVLVKLAGQVVPDPNTGQLTTVFDNNPQLPFSDFKLNFFGGPRGALVTPESCGTFTTTSSLTPWSGQAPAAPSDSFTITTGCVNGFSPLFTAGVTNAHAGAFSPFVLSLSRKDTDQELSGLSVSLPPGVLAKLAGVQLCADANANAGTCPTGSQVGTVEAGAGPGPNPFFLPGKLFLTGPYKGGPYGLEVAVPAIAGPFNLGVVVVRQSIQIDPTDAHVSVVSDPFPTILQGIPLRMRRVDVKLDRPNFIVNPTSCDAMQITGTLTSTQGLSHPVSSRLQVGDCQKLPFSPKLLMALAGKRRTTSGTHPTLTATLSASGGANLHSARVTLPLSMALDPFNSQHVCSYPVALAVHGGAVSCPPTTIVGSASATTPLLDQPLTGPVYLVQGIRFNNRHQQIRTLPTLLIPLRGQVALDLRARSSVDGAGRLVTTFSSIPDASVSSFKLTITGGPKGLLVITGVGQSICKAPQVATATLGAQSGKTESVSVNMSTPCGKAGKPPRGRRHPKTARRFVHDL